MVSEPPFGEFVDRVCGNITEPEEIEAKFDADECELPLIDLSRLNLGKVEHNEECKRKICEASAEWGFFQIVNHGVSPEILSQIHREQVESFRQPFRMIKTNEKLVNLSSGCHHYCGAQTATTWKKFGWSEAFHIPVTTISRLNELEDLRSSLEDFAMKASELAQQIAATLAENLGCESTFFSKNCLPSSCYIRMNRYPACPSKVFGLIPHTDSDFLTVLHQDQVGGLQLLRDGNWIRVKPNPDALVINIGDLFQAWSNGAYKSVEHRVVANHENERFSLAYFFCPSHDTVIESCSTTHGPSMYRKFSFGEYRQQVQEDVKITGNKVGLSRFLNEASASNRPQKFSSAIRKDT